MELIMLGNRQSIAQKQNLQQKLSPQQIQFVNLLQLSMSDLEQRVQSELESNPILEFLDETENFSADQSSSLEGDAQTKTEVDWQNYFSQFESGGSIGGGRGTADLYDIPKPYQESPIEVLEQQVDLLDLSEKQKRIADQIIGSLDEDGYLRREIRSVADSIAFNYGEPVSELEVLDVLLEIQKLDPPGIAARDLQECLLIQLRALDDDQVGKHDAIRILRKEWDAFEKKQFDRIKQKLQLSDEHIQHAYQCIQHLNPKPGWSTDPSILAQSVTPDAMILPLSDDFNPGDADALVGDLAIIMNRKNRPKLALSPHYIQMLAQLKASGSVAKETKEAEQFIRTKMDAAQWFLDAIDQRHDLVKTVIKAILGRQYGFFMQGTALKPLIMKDIADELDIDISTVSRTVNGKFIHSPQGIYELRYFFNERIGTSDGEDVTKREVQDALKAIIDHEDKRYPLSDQALTDQLRAQGFDVARRTVTKYREAIDIPVARLRKAIIA
jgi:RNA polymerase sigma-54 factor